jgi:hypothetical protein
VHWRASGPVTAHRQECLCHGSWRPCRAKGRGSIVVPSGCIVKQFTDFVVTLAFFRRQSQNMAVSKYLSWVHSPRHSPFAVSTACAEESCTSGAGGNRTLRRAPPEGTGGRRTQPHEAQRPAGPASLWIRWPFIFYNICLHIKIVIYVSTAK